MSQVRITQHCRENCLPNLPKQLRPGFINKLRTVGIDPDLGKPLSGELKPYRTLRLGRYRIIYLYDPADDVDSLCSPQVVWVVSVGIRKAGARDDVYQQLLRDLHAGEIPLEE